MRQYIRVSCVGIAPNDLDDLGQEFFRKFLEDELLNRLDRDRGRFRDFLFTAVRNFTRQQIHKGKRPIPQGPLARLDRVEESPNKPDLKAVTPEEAFHRAWARQLMDDALTAFRAECADRNKPHYLAVFEELVLGTGPTPKPNRAEVAERHNLTVKDVSNYLARSQKLFQRTLRDHIATTLSDPTDDPAIDAELDALRQYFQ